MRTSTMMASLMMVFMVLDNSVMAAEKVVAYFKLPEGARFEIPKNQKNKKGKTTNVIAVVEVGNQKYWLHSGDAALTWRTKEVKSASGDQMVSVLAIGYDDAAVPEALGFGVTMAPKDPKSKKDVNNLGAALMKAKVGNDAVEEANQFLMESQDKSVWVVVSDISPDRNP